MAKTKKNPTVSIIIATYNRAHYIGRAIQSVLNQTYQDFEVIIVNDASTDDTEEVVKSFNDERLRYIQLSKNSGGAPVPRNAGIRAARGEYIAFLDDDDEWLPEKLEKQVNKFKSVSSDVGVVYHGYVYVNEQTGEKLFEVIPDKKGDVFELLLEKGIVGDTTPLVRKECFKRVGLYDTEFLGTYDRDMWLRVAKCYKFDFVPEILAKYYMHGNQNIASLENRIQGLDRITRKYQVYLSKAVFTNRLRYLGTLCCLQGGFEKGSRYFREAINNNPRNVIVYMQFMLCKFAPRFYQARIRRRMTEAVNKRGEIFLW